MYRNFIPRLCSLAKWAALNILVTLGWDFLTNTQKYRNVTLNLQLDVFLVIITSTNILCLRTSYLQLYKYENKVLINVAEVTHRIVLYVNILVAIT